MIWRIIPSNPNYGVSEDGSIWRVVPPVNAPDGATYPRKLKSILRPDGYLQVVLSSGKGTLASLVHRVVCSAFLGPCPPGMEVAHKDGDKTNCAISNLRYDTPTGNAADKIVHGTAPIGVHNGMAKPENARRAILVRRLFADGFSRADAAFVAGMAYDKAKRVLRGELWAQREP